MMKNLLLTLFSGFFLMNVNAQYSISGKVTDEKGNALEGSSVAIVAAEQGTFTDESGLYRLRIEQAGLYEVQVSFIGFETQVKTVDVDGNKILDFVMEKSAVLTHEVTISATRARETSPIAFETLEMEEIEERNTAEDLPYLLDFTPSFVSSSEAGIGVGYTSFRIRGTDPSRINVTINGIPFNDAESQGVFFVDIPDFATTLNSVQIQRGVGTSASGVASFGGSINFNTGSNSVEPFVKFDNSVGSFNTFKNSLYAGSGLLNDHFLFEMKYSIAKTDGFIDYAFSDHRSLYAAATYLNDNMSLKFNFIHGDEQTGISWWGVPDYKIEEDRTYNPAGWYFDDYDDNKEKYYKNQTDNYIQDHYQLIYNQKINENLNLNLTLNYTDGEGFYEQYMETENDFHDTDFSIYGLDNIVFADGETVTQSDMVRQKWLENKFYAGIFSLTYENEKWFLAAGGGYNQYDGDHFGKILWMRRNNGVPKDYEWYLNTSVKKELSAFAKTEYSLKSNLILFADVQWRNVSYDMKGPDDDLFVLDQEHNFDFVNPKVGVSYLPSKNSKLYAYFGIANREPARADFKDAKGDPSSYPKAETLYDYELGYRQSSEKAAFGINLYYMSYDDQLVLTGEKSNVGYDIKTNVPESYRAGIELDAKVGITRFLEWQGNATFSQNKILEYVAYSAGYDENWNEITVAEELGTTDISYSPEIIAKSRFNVEISEFFDVDFKSRYVGKQYFDNTSSDERSIDPYFVNDVTFNFNIETSWFDALTIQMHVNNVLDAEYESNAYGGYWFEQGERMNWAYYYPQAGRYYLLRTLIDF